MFHAKDKCSASSNSVPKLSAPLQEARMFMQTRLVGSLPNQIETLSLTPAPTSPPFAATSTRWKRRTRYC